MKTYGHVTFLTPGDRGGAEQQRTFAKDLIKAGIIKMTNDKIEEYFQKDKNEPVGGIWHVVLHNRKERKAFLEIMDRPDYSFNPTIFYQVSMTPKSKEFGHWLKSIQEVKKIEKRCVKDVQCKKV